MHESTGTAGAPTIGAMRNSSPTWSRRRVPWPLATAVAALLGGACSTGPSIRTDVDPTADFSRYRTFAFHEPFGLDRDDYATPVANIVRAAIRTELERRGFAFAQDAPDLLVNAGGMLTRRQRVDTVPGHLGPHGYYGYRSGRYAGWPGYSEVVVTDYQEGTLTIDVVDPARRQMVWSSTAVDRVTQSELARRDEILPRVIAEMFQDFPVEPPGAAGAAAR